jgi:hypothetical protein
MSMRRTVFILIVSLFATIKVLGQDGKPVSPNYTKGKNNASSFGINIPVGEFSKTHFAGISLDYSWSHHRFGNLKALPKKLIELTANGGIAYYFGKKEMVAGYDYRYGGYLYLHAFAGAIYNPCKKGNITLTTGPSLGIYKGSADVGFGIKVGGSYSITDKIALRPEIIFLKHHEAAPLWVVAMRAVYSF